MSDERFLLDTHILLWILNDENKLSKRHRSILTEKPLLVVSAVSIWEIAIKSSLGKLRVRPDFFKVILESESELLPITPEHAFGVASLPRIHGDPFDRLLVAQALQEKLTVMTVDRRLAPYGVEII